MYCTVHHATDCCISDVSSVYVTGLWPGRVGQLDMYIIVYSVSVTSSFADGGFSAFGLKSLRSSTPGALQLASQGQNGIYAARANRRSWVTRGPGRLAVVRRELRT